MPIHVTCDCGKKLKVKEELAGKSIRCPGCQATVRVSGKRNAAKEASPTKANVAKRAVDRQRDDDETPSLVSGHVVRRSVVKTIGTMAFLAVLFVFCLFLVWAKVAGQIIDPSSLPKEVTWWGLILGIGGVLCSPVGIVYLGYLLLVKRRLVIGDDRIQIAQRSDEIMLQIPYRNIGKLEYEVTDTERRIGMCLKDTEDANTYDRAGSKWESTETMTGWHYVLNGGYQESVQQIHKRIKDRMKRLRNGD